MIFSQNLMLSSQNLVIFSQNLVIFSQNLMLSSQNLSVKPVGLYQFASYCQNPYFVSKNDLVKKFIIFLQLFSKLTSKVILFYKYLMIQIYPNIWQFFRIRYEIDVIFVDLSQETVKRCYANWPIDYNGHTIYDCLAEVRFYSSFSSLTLFCQIWQYFID